MNCMNKFAVGKWMLALLFSISAVLMTRAAPIPMTAWIGETQCFDWANSEAPVVKSQYTNQWVGLTYKENVGGDFSIALRLERSAPGGSFFGVVLRTISNESYEVMLSADHFMIRKQPECKVLIWEPWSMKTGQGVHLTILATDDRLQVYADDRVLGKLIGVNRWSGAFSLLSIYATGKFGPVQVSTNPPGDIRPHPSLPAWAFPSAKTVSLPLRIRDGAGVSRPFNVIWRLYHGTNQVKQGSSAFAVPPRQWRDETLTVEVLEKPLQWLELLTPGDNGAVFLGRWPIAIVSGDPAKGAPGRVTAGVYGKDKPPADDCAAHTCVHALSCILSRYGINTYVCGREVDRESLDIFHQYGIRVVLRIDQKDKAIMEHPAVLAYMIGDEPKMKDLSPYKTQYDSFRRAWPNRPIWTCMIGEEAALPEMNTALLWRELNVKERLWRYYPFRKARYDLLSVMNYKPQIEASDDFAWMSALGDQPWTYVAQTFGFPVSTNRPDPYWRSPTADEMTAAIHLAMIFGAKGYIGYTLQSEGDSFALVKPATLEAEDNNLTALSECNRRITHWPASSWGQPSEPARAAGLPDTLITRRLADGVIGLVNADTRNGMRLAVPGLKPAENYAAIGNGTWVRQSAWHRLKQRFGLNKAEDGPMAEYELNIPAGGLAFARAPDGWGRPEQTSAWSLVCKDLIRVMRQGESWPARIEVEPVSGNASFYAPAAGDAAFSPLTVFKQMQCRGTNGWSLEIMGKAGDRDVWRTAQVAYGWGARSVVDRESKPIRFGPFGGAAPAAVFHELAGQSTFPNTEARSMDRRILLMPRLLNKRLYLVLFNSNQAASIKTIIEVGAAATRAVDGISRQSFPVRPFGKFWRCAIEVPADKLMVLDWSNEATDGKSETEHPAN